MSNDQAYQDAQNWEIVKSAFAQCAVYSGILEFDDLVALIKKEQR